MDVFNSEKRLWISESKNLEDEEAQLKREAEKFEKKLKDFCPRKVKKREPTVEVPTEVEEQMDSDDDNIAHRPKILTKDDPHYQEKVDALIEEMKNDMKRISKSMKKQIKKKQGWVEDDEEEEEEDAESEDVDHDPSKEEDEYKLQTIDWGLEGMDLYLIDSDEGEAIAAEYKAFQKRLKTRNAESLQLNKKVYTSKKKKPPAKAAKSIRAIQQSMAAKKEKKYNTARVRFSSSSDDDDEGFDPNSLFVPGRVSTRGSSKKMKEFYQDIKIEDIKLEDEEVVDGDGDGDDENDEDEPKPFTSQNTKIDDEKSGTSKQAAGEREEGAKFEERTVTKETVRRILTEDEEVDGEFRELTSINFRAKMEELKHWNVECEPILRAKFKDQYDEILERIHIRNYTSAKELYTDKPVMKNGSMPVLGIPITGNAKQLKSLEMVKFAHGGVGNYFWKSPNVHDQMTLDLQQAESVENEKMFDTGPESILYVTMYQQSPPDDTLVEELNKKTEPIVAFTIEILLSHTVEDLMKMMICPNDFVYLKDVESPDDFDRKEHEKHLAKNVIKGKVLLLGNKLYFDEDCQQSCLIYEEINSWTEGLQKKEEAAFTFPSVSATILKGDLKTPLRKIICKFGYPCVFIHLGACEHLYTFSQMSFKKNGVDRSLFPRRTEIAKYKVLHCNVENERYADWLVYEYDRLPSSPAALCSVCLKEYCYFRGNKIGSFKLYPIEQFIPKLYPIEQYLKKNKK